MATHSLLNAFRANKPAFGVWLTTPGFFHARTVAQASPALSWVALDCEHGLPGVGPALAESIAAVHGARAAGADAPSALVRIAATGLSDSTSWQIKHALDAGARGVLVPMVSSALKAQEVVADSLFPPRGRRGYGSSFTHYNWGLSATEYLAQANDAVVVMVQIETPEGLANVREIAAVDGIDVLFIGPYDLSISLGYPAPAPDPHPAVEKEIQHIKEEVHKAGKKCAIYCITGAQAARRAAEGFDMINVISDVGAMSSAILEHVATAAGIRSEASGQESVIKPQFEVGAASV
ncbi:Pyruvate/Phosphoenolpyruvate kinase-like domain-containing protein [Mycena pura]|uniref:Pyruvate/Phosphoenolpyruvate kinase-like domain-containing protein n=1 Tax=Mycena pura TaxID=153505 RepID=A0AAD6VKR2_9AGAR|nr:Pyruvate/Phosphoenolpyruvate kinase-like domain-containing protein [Mycena pura]